MINKKVCSVVFLFIFYNACAESNSLDCQEKAVTLEKLTLYKCMDGESPIFKYRDISSTSVSPEISEFDQRNFVFEISNNSDFLIKKAGMALKGGYWKLVSTKLIRPPLEEKILIRHIEKKALHHAKWLVHIERIQYGAQGQIPGYPMKCGTAVYKENLSGKLVVAAECFDYTDQGRFLKTLSDLSSKLENRDKKVTDWLILLTILEDRLALPGVDSETQKISEGYKRRKT